jgi:hypothetical protein
MTVPQQKLQESDHRCRLAVPSLHVPRTHLSWHWDPDPLARWNTVIPTCRLVSRAGPMQRNLLLECRTGAGKLMVKLGLVSSNG